ncbi:MAG: tripartite tricarboxylate transporter substrate binding protein [Burkholderiales bacterium]|nr:tripartite tricarboxylate transporter substrate binding protein [Burkholderiales bacterium]
MKSSSARNVRVKRVGMIGLALAALGANALSAYAAESFPSRPVRVITPYGAGGSYDLIARLISQRLAEQVGQQVLVDNRPGAAGRLGMEIATKANPDGYNLVVVGNTQVIAPIVYQKVPYSLDNNFTPVSMVATITNTLVVYPGVQARSVKEFVALTKAKPGSVSFGSGGTGGITHLAGELFKSMSGADITHVPYKAGIGATNAALGGEVQMIFLNAFSATPLIKAGKLRGLATTGAKRSSHLPDLPTLDEVGYKGYELVEFHSLMLPAATPPELIARWNAEVRKALDSADVREKLALQAAEPAASSPAELRKRLQAEHQKYADIVRSVGIKPE